MKKVCIRKAQATVVSKMKLLRYEYITYPLLSPNVFKVILSLMPEVIPWNAMELITSIK